MITITAPCATRSFAGRTVLPAATRPATRTSIGQSANARSAAKSTSWHMPRPIPVTSTRGQEGWFRKPWIKYADASSATDPAREPSAVCSAASTAGFRHQTASANPTPSPALIPPAQRATSHAPSSHQPRFIALEALSSPKYLVEFPDAKIAEKSSSRSRSVVSKTISV